MAVVSHYLIALGSNIRHHRHGSPRNVLIAALSELADAGLTIIAFAPIMDSAPVGPSQRRYANSVLEITTDLEPDELLDLLQIIEADFGRKQSGQRWAARVLDLDIILWSGGSFADGGLIIPHPSLRERDFVLAPAAAIAPDWRDPISGLTIKHLHTRLTRPRPTPR